MITVPFTYELLVRGIPCGEANATAHIVIARAFGGWEIHMITVRDLRDSEDVELLPADFLACTAALYSSPDFRSFREDVEEAARDFRLGRVSYDREMAKAS